jgi:uncharacterized protein (TIGR02246 family)
MKMPKRAGGEAAKFTSTQAEIAAALQVYETALNASNVDAVMGVFAPDGVFMPPNNPSVVGTEAIRGAYGGIFQAVSFDTELLIEEIEHVAPNWAFVRTSSAGFVNVLAIGQRVPDANHELFVFKKGDDGKWKIARYCFSTTIPLPQSA